MFAHLRFSVTFNIKFGNSCPLGKGQNLPLVFSNSASNFSLELLHSDVWTSVYLSNSGYKYYLIFVDDFSPYSWLFSI